MINVMSGLLKQIEIGELRIPSLPKVAANIIELTSDEDIPTIKLVEIIEKSQSIVTKLLKIANSPIYRGTKEVKTTKGAFELEHQFLMLREKGQVAQKPPTTTPQEDKQEHSITSE